MLEESIFNFNSDSVTINSELQLVCETESLFGETDITYNHQIPEVGEYGKD